MLFLYNLLLQTNVLCLNVKFIIIYIVITKTHVWISGRYTLDKRY